MSNLSKSIKGLYDGKISDEEATLACDRFIGFMDVLAKIAERRENDRQKAEQKNQTKKPIKNDILYEV
jgi:hypothetical protein